MGSVGMAEAEGVGAAGEVRGVPAEAAAPDDGFGQVKSLSKGLAALDVVLEEGAVRTTDLAERLGIDKGGASRILRTLVQAGYAQRVADRRYAPGAKFAAAAPRALAGGPANPAAATYGLKRRVRPLLQRLVDETGECAHLGIVADDQVLYLDTADSKAPLRVDRPAGTLSPMYCTALGKIFMAFCGAAVPPVMQAHTPNTTTDPERFRAKIRAVVERGYAVDDEELYLGVRCVAAPLRAADGSVIAALGLSGPSSRIDAKRLAELGDLVRSVAATLPAA